MAHLCHVQPNPRNIFSAIQCRHHSDRMSAVVAFFEGWLNKKLSVYRNQKMSCNCKHASSLFRNINKWIYKYEGPSLWANTRHIDHILQVWNRVHFRTWAANSTSIWCTASSQSFFNYSGDSSSHYPVKDCIIHPLFIKESHKTKNCSVATSIRSSFSLVNKRYYN